MYTPVNPSFIILKWGLRGSNYIGMFSWCEVRTKENHKLEYDGPDHRQQKPDANLLKQIEEGNVI